MCMHEYLQLKMWSFYFPTVSGFGEKILCRSTLAVYSNA